MRCCCWICAWYLLLMFLVLFVISLDFVDSNGCVVFFHIDSQPVYNGENIEEKWPTRLWHAANASSLFSSNKHSLFILRRSFPFFPMVLYSAFLCTFLSYFQFSYVLYTKTKYTPIHKRGNMQAHLPHSVVFVETTQKNTFFQKKTTKKKKQ